MKLKLRESRLMNHMTQQAVADYLVVEATTYSRYERGERQPSLGMIVRLAELYKVSTDYLLGVAPSEQAVLSEPERKLISAFRNADERAREDALSVLLYHRQD